MGIGILALVVLGIIGFASWFLLRGCGEPTRACSRDTDT